MEAPAARLWLRCTSAILTAVCAFWGCLTAVTNLLIYALMQEWFTWEPGEVADDILNGSFYLGAGLVALFVTRWQFVRMRGARVKDHAILLVLLAILAVALLIQPFAYTIF